ncbi:zincin-like metallopeptidase toxin 4 of polymorphic toxin system [Elizabethkingia sp. YR214]|uniref:zincin-like metallopeptidase toxin domain-containing protein n=1 Tax=Elizabethkingia sp. YR214 TaxID=2135667 RepID=UPI000D327323|nr:zincin-like metallopeptidase toxin domain-containing protein [Elizabethkingia sp. YR214]PUB28106.1 zincin-like metallopeptidase toxin 4 of polymorphic toxin system [Elizabethkingia sp. YR214]
MIYKEYLDDFDENSKEILMASARSIIPIQKLQQRNYGNLRDVMVDKVRLGETIRGMQNVSPLAEMKFFNQTADQIFSKYFPDGNDERKGNTNIIEDISITIKNGYKFNSYNYYFDNNHNGIYGDQGDTMAFRLLLFVSDDGNKVKECYEVVKPADDEVILFLESDKDTFSRDALYGRMSDKIRKQFTDKNGNLKSNLFDNEIMKSVRMHADINQEVITELMKNGYIEDEIITKGFFIFLRYVMMGVSAPAKALGWVSNKIGDGIDFLKIPDKFWDTESEGYYFQKDTLIENLSIPTDKLNTLKNLFTDKKGFNLTDITPQLVDDIILKQIATIEAFIGNYNSYVKAKIEGIFKDIENPHTQQQTEDLAERIALVCGLWNGLVDFVSSIFKFLGSLLEAPFDISKDFQYTLELVDNFLALLNDEKLWENVDNAASEAVKNIMANLKEKNSEDVNWVRVYYIAGFTISFIGTFFIPIADVAKFSEVGNVGDILAKLNKEVSEAIFQTTNFVKNKTAEGYQKAGKVLQELLEMFAKGGKKLQDFVEKLWKEIAEWLLKNKELVEGWASKIKQYLSKEGKTEEFFRKIEKKFNLAGQEILSANDIKTLRRLLKETFGVALEFVDQNPALKAKLKDWTARRVAGSFNMLEGKMYLRKSVTAYTVQHEMFHMKLWYKMTKEFSELQPLFQKTLGRENVLFHEEYVLAEFMKNPNKWSEADLLNDLENINSLRRENNLPTVELEYFKKWNLQQELLKFK